MAPERITRVELPCTGGHVAFEDPEFPPVGGKAQAVRLVVSVSGLSFSYVVAAHGDGYRLDDFFADLERSWRGWEGEKHWYDDGVRVRLWATHDGRGHVWLRLTS